MRLIAWIKSLGEKEHERRRMPTKAANKARTPRLRNGMPVPKPNQTKIFRKGIF